MDFGISWFAFNLCVVHVGGLRPETASFSDTEEIVSGCAVLVRSPQLYVKLSVAISLLELRKGIYLLISIYYIVSNCVWNRRVFVLFVS
jgi:hypothetical protein